MRRLDAHAHDAVAEDVGALVPFLRMRRDVDAAFHDVLAVDRARQQAQRAGVGGHRRFVAIAREMAHFIDHARPVTFSARA